MSVLIWGTVAVFTVLYISLIFSNNIWTDEAFTIQLLKENLQGIISGTAKDVHPPLYYIYLKAFVKIFGNSLISMKIASVIPLTGTLLLILIILHYACYNYHGIFIYFNNYMEQKKNFIMDNYGSRYDSVLYALVSKLLQTGYVGKCGLLDS